MDQRQGPERTRVEDLAPQHDELAGWRQHLHRHPELAFAEHETSELVAGKLAQWGYEVTRGIGGTGLVKLNVNYEMVDDDASAPITITLINDKASY